jgi:hypothetical protein
MGWLNRKKKHEAGAAVSDGEHAVVINYRLSGDEYGSAEEREGVFALENRLEALIEQHGIGEFDGNEFGGGEAVLYCYGPDANRLFATIENEVRSFAARPAYVTLRYGAASDPNAQERRIDL